MKLLKNLSVVVFICMVLVSFSLYEGCTTSQQTTGYQTLYGLETGATAAYTGYISSVVKGTTSTNSVPTISRAYNTFQAALLPALDAVQYSTNALAPTNLVQESSDLLNLITTAQGH